MAFLNCLVCKNLFYTSHKDRQKYCSRHCYFALERQRIPSKKWLYQKYYIKQLSVAKVAKLIKRNPATVYRYLKNAKIQLRTRSEARLIISEEIANRIKGNKHPNWKGGISSQNRLLRSSKEYKRWKQAVLNRDHYTCCDCGSKKNLHAHHIKPFSLYPKLRFCVSNGKTLCIICHERYRVKRKKIGVI